MMNRMASKLINAEYEIKTILGEKKYFKKIQVSNRIRKLKKELYSLIDTDKYLAKDIVNLCFLIDIASLTGLCTHESNNVHTTLIKGNNRNKWPVVGIVIINTDDLIIEIKSHMDSDMDADGDIDIRWIVHDVNKYPSTIQKTHDVTYSYSCKEISKDTVLYSASKDLTDYMATTYKIIPNIFTIFIENILDGLKEKYLK